MSTPLLLIHPGPVPVEALDRALASALATLPEPPAMRWWTGRETDAERAAVRYALVSRLPAAELARFPALALVGSLHAGVDHLLAGLPARVPLTRPVPAEDGDPLMNEYVLTQVLRHHRDLPAYAQAQREGRWLRLPLRPARQRRVGVLGLGAMGRAAADTLARAGFDVAGWTRRPRPESPWPVFHGETGLRALLERSEIVVNLLPLTPETRDLLDARRLAWMPRGASLINVGRGEHVVDADLLAALDAGQLGAATLDVFREEPLPPDNPLWRHPAITITPHACRRVDVAEVVAQFVDNLARLRAGQPLARVVDRAAGY